MIFDQSIAFYIVASLAVFLVGIAKGGFAGLGAAAMPLLALVMDPVAGAGMLLPILMAQDILSVWAFRKSFDRRTLLIMVPGALVGVVIAWWLAAMVSGDAVRGAVGVIAVIFGSYRLAGPLGMPVRVKGQAPEWVGTLFGALSGFTSQIAHAGGPPFQIWALTRNLPHLTFIGTSAIFFAIVNWMKLPAYFALGQFTAANMTLTALFMPLAIASTLFGVWVVKRISPARFNLVINVLIVVVGLELIRQTIW